MTHGAYVGVAPVEDDGVDFHETLNSKEISSRTKDNIVKLYAAFGVEKVFGRADVIDVLKITEKPASTLLGKMYSLHLTEKITGAGKGKYRFIMPNDRNLFSQITERNIAK